MTWRRTMRAWVVAALLIAWTDAHASAQQPEFPAASPESVGVDSRALIRLSAWIRDERLDVRALLVVKDGRLVFERYSQGLTREHNHAVYSVTKSITSTLIGMLIDDGKIAVADTSIVPLLSAGPQARRLDAALQDKRAITIGHVLSMTSGLRYQHDPERNPIYAAGDRLAAALDVPIAAPPGTQFQYSDGDATIVGALVVAASGQSLEAFARERLFGPLQMRHVEWPGADRQGLHPGGWALRLRAIDMAKLGQFALDGGVWNGARLVSADWMKLATTRKSGTDFGYYWRIDPYGEAGMSAEGFKGQRIVALTRRHVVIVVAAVFPRGRESPLMRQMVRDFIVPATDAGAALAPSEALSQALAAELTIARQTRGEARNTLEPQDTPRR